MECHLCIADMDRISHAYVRIAKEVQSLEEDLQDLQMLMETSPEDTSSLLNPQEERQLLELTMKKTQGQYASYSTVLALL